MVSIVRYNAKYQNHVHYIKIKACKSIIFKCQYFPNNNYVRPQVRHGQSIHS